MRWFKIGRVLRDRPDAPAAPARDGFWADFRARARMTPQEAPGTRHASPLQWVPEWTTAAVCVLLVLVMGWYLLVPGARDDGSPNKVHSLRVSVPYAALLMMYDPSSKATIVWVDGMDMDDENDGA